MHFESIYMILCEIIVIGNEFKIPMLRNKTQSQLIMKLEQKKMWGWCLVEFDFTNKKFHLTYFVKRHPDLQKDSRGLSSICHKCNVWGR